MVLEQDGGKASKARFPPKYNVAVSKKIWNSLKKKEILWRNNVMCSNAAYAAP
jgi:hypothetical protein